MMTAYHPSSSSNVPHPVPPPLRASDYANDGKPHLLLCASGSVATIKIPNIISALADHPISIRLILTHSASEFLRGQSAEQPSLKTIATLANVDGIYTDEDEWREPWVRGNTILHIELRRWADVMVIAPLGANSLAKIAGGLCGDLLGSVVRAWDTTGLIDTIRDLEAIQHARSLDRNGTGDRPVKGDQESALLERPQEQRPKKRIVVAPAMNTAMWRHPITQQQIKLLEGSWNVSNGGWIEVLRPQEKELACGDTGDGAMRDWRGIVTVIEKRLCLVRDESNGGYGRGQGKDVEENVAENDMPVHENIEVETTFRKEMEPASQGKRSLREMMLRQYVP